jgi:PAS domain S-box-containing protein
VAIGLAIILGLVLLFLNQVVPPRIEALAMTAHGDRATAVARLAAFGASPALYFGDDVGVTEAIEAVETDPQVLYVVVRDVDGRAVARWTKPGAIVEVGAVQGADADGIAFHATAPALHEGSSVGSVTVGLSLAEVHRAVADIRRSLGWSALLAFGLGLLGVATVGTVVTNPLRRVVETAQRISDGDLSVRVPAGGRDEIGDLGASFNRMVERLESAHAVLARSNRDLEEGVRARTAELEHEVEERRRAEALLRESEARFRTMFESSAIGIVLLTPGGRVLAANPAAHRMLSADPGRLERRQLLRMFEGGPPEGLEVAAAELVAGHRKEVQADVRVRGPREGMTWLHMGLSVVRGQGEVDMTIATLEDITEQKSLEERLAQSQKLEAVGRLAGGVAHDFNNILTTINGLAEEARTELPDTHPVRADLDEIQKAGWRAADLTRQLLAFGRRQMLQPRLLDLNDVIRDTAGLLRRLVNEHVRVVLNLEDGLPPMEADPSQLVQVLLNLAANARDAMPDGGELRISTARVDLSEEGSLRMGTQGAGPHLALRVQDTGMGIEESQQALIFEPFYTTKGVGKGTGLGLATVYGIVKQSGGAVTVRSRPGEGTTFTVFMPAVMDGVVIPPEPVQPRVDQEDNGSETVLLVEDEPSVRRLLARVLGRAGYHVLEASNGIQALEVENAFDGPIEAVITDVIMPEMGGVELVRVLQRSRPGLTVLFVSGYTRGEVLEGSALTDSRCIFMSKPFSPEQLVAALRDALDQRVTPA